MSKRVLVMISGGGTNLQALIDAVKNGELDAEIVAVVSNKSAAGGLERAQKAGIDTLTFTMKPYREGGKSRAQFDADLAGHVQAFQPDLIVLAGWMHVLSPAFLDHFPNRVINLHPALPGHFAGINAIERAYDAYQQGEITHTGCMVHYVVPEVDAGPVIAHAEVPIHADDTLETLAARMHETEHKVIVQATGLMLDAL